MFLVSFFMSPRWTTVMYKKEVRYTMKSPMLTISIIHHYLWWHYGKALSSYLRITKNIWWFLVQVFSLSLLARSLFTPLKRIHETRQRTGNFEDLAGALLINTLSRLFGLVIRLVIIISGLATLLLFSTLSIVLYALWLIAPIALIGSFGYGSWLLLGAV